MNNIYAFATRIEDDISDSLSSMGAKSVSIESIEAPSPHFIQLSELCDIDALSNQTKKIRKKRCAYDKIDDDKRIQLLNAVQKCGESLKSAAKRLDINYSSAKSILHTFRKEGRILKKSPLETNIRTFPIYTMSSTAMEVSPMNNGFRNLPPRFPSQGAIPLQNNMAKPCNPVGNGGSSPMRGLTSIFANLGLDNADNDLTDDEPSFMNILLEKPQPKEQVSIPKLNGFVSDSNTSISTDESLDAKEIKIPNLSESSSNIPNPTLNQMISNPLELLKKIDNFYMNYSNSPLSGGKGTMFGDCSDSGSRKYCAKEFDSFSDMLTAFQTPGSCTDELKGEFHRLNSIQDKFELKLIKEESTDSSPGGGNSGLENFVPRIDPQWLMSDSLRKATFLSNLGQFQRPGISLVNERNK